MNPYEMMFRSGVMTEWRRESRWAVRRMTNRALREIAPKDQTWAIALIAGSIVVANVALFVRFFV